MIKKKAVKKVLPKLKKFSLNMVILGDPGAGKATQSAYFAKKYNMFDFDMGRELTLLREKDHAVERAQRRTADKGILTPTNIVRAINKKIVLGLPKSRAILFDGHPKMVGEAKIIAKYLEETNRTLPLVLYIKIPEKEIIKRTKLRKGYTDTNSRKRADDTIAGLRNRAKYYRKNIAEVVKFFKSVYTFATIDGMGTRAEVQKRIQKAIDFYIKHYEQIHENSRRN